MPVQKTCEVCGKEYEVANRRSETSKACSMACSGVLQAKRYSEQRRHLQCLQCGKPIEVSAGRAERGNGLYCNRDCKRLSQFGRRFTDLVEDGKETLLGTGYVYEQARTHPFAVRGRVFQHRLVIERLLRQNDPTHPFLVEVDGERYLRPDIDVHHKNEVKDDNRPENLMACTKPAHKDMHEGRTPMKGETWPEVGDAVAVGPRLLLRTCVHCKGTFTVKRSDAERGGRNYCSKQCFYDSRNPDGLPAQVPRVCEGCGGGFMARRYKVIHGTARYCSNECRGKSTRKPHTS